MYLFRTPSTETATDRLVVIFADPKSGKTHIIHARPNSQYSTSEFPELNSVNDLTTAYIQVRKLDGTRETISPRGRIGWIRFLDTVTAEQLLQSPASVENKDQDTYKIAIGMASWINDSASENSIERILAEIHKHENTFGISSSMTLYRNILGSLPPGLTFKPTRKKNTAGISTKHLFDNVWDSLEDFLAAKNLPIGKHRIYHNELPIDMELDFVFGQPLVVALHGRKAPTVKLPYLSGSGVLEGLRLSRLSISDPSFYLDNELSIAWYAGNKKQPELQETLARISKFVAEKVEASRVIFFGGSAGGFASIQLSHKIANSVALVWNAQTDFTQYYRRFYDEYLSACWSADNSSIPSNITSSVVELFNSSEGLGKSILYLQQTTDEHHVKLHLKPFIDVTRGKGKTLLLQRNWSPGHTPPPKDILKDVLSIAAESDVQAAAVEYGFEPI